MLKKLLNSQENKNNDYIYDVYGSTRYSYVGHSRFPWDVPDISNDTLAIYIKELNKIDIPYHFVMNNIWLKSRENNDLGRDLIKSEMRALIDIGVKGFILANPALLIHARKWFPEIELTASINLEITSSSRIEEYLKFGANKVVVGRDITRDFQVLRKLSDKYSDVLIFLMNSSCMLYCPLQNYHSLVTGYESMSTEPFVSPSSQRSSSSKILPINSRIQQEMNQDTGFCFNYCYGRLVENPAEILKMPWIRPEDIVHYTDLGFHLFKIQGRTKSVSSQEEILLAYLNRKIPNDDFLFMWPNIRTQMKDFIKKNPSLNQRDFDFEISNSELDNMGFMEHFLTKTYDCRNGCENCSFCERIFQKIAKKSKIKQ